MFGRKYSGIIEQIMKWRFCITVCYSVFEYDDALQRYTAG